jgi:hypothetical protein
MDEQIRKKIEEIIGQMKCPKGFTCAGSGLEVLCKARDIGLESFLECLAEDRRECPFVVEFGDAFFCQCPLRGYIARKLGR